MDSFFDWLQNTGISVWIAESDSIWGFPFILFAHSLGMGLSAGSAFVVGLRLLGIGRPIPVSSFQMFFKIFWIGFVLNLASGTLLFVAHATSTGHVPMYYAKLLFILFGVLVSIPIRRFIDHDGDRSVPARIKVMAGVSVALWLAVITTGRLIAYVS